MARQNSFYNENNSSIYGDSEEPSSTPPVAGSSSDKENGLSESTRARKRNQSKNMESSNAESSSGNKRQKLADRDSNARNLSRFQSQSQTQTQSQSQIRSSQTVNDKDIYDPDQDVEERRRVRKGLRDIAKDLNGKYFLLIQCYPSDTTNSLNLSFLTFGFVIQIPVLNTYKPEMMDFTERSARQMSILPTSSRLQMLRLTLVCWSPPPICPTERQHN